MATEHATVGRRGFYSSFPQMGPAVGFLLSSGLFLVLSASLSSTTLPYCTMISVAIMGFAVPIFAALWALPLFWLVDTQNPLLIALSSSVGMVIFAMPYGPMGAFLPELYGTRLRYSGAAVSYNPGGVFGGAFAP